MPAVYEYDPLTAPPYAEQKGGDMGHMGSLINPCPWRGRCRAGSSNIGGPLLPRKTKQTKNKHYHDGLKLWICPAGYQQNEFTRCLLFSVWILFWESDDSKDRDRQKNATGQQSWVVNISYYQHRWHRPKWLRAGNLRAKRCDRGSSWVGLWRIFFRLFVLLRQAV